MCIMTSKSINLSVFNYNYIIFLYIIQPYTYQHTSHVQPSHMYIFKKKKRTRSFSSIVASVQCRVQSVVLHAFWRKRELVFYNVLVTNKIFIGYLNDVKKMQNKKNNHWMFLTNNITKKCLVLWVHKHLYLTVENAS